MLLQESTPARRPPLLALALSLILHGIVLFAPLAGRQAASRPPPARLQASLAPTPATAVAPQPVVPRVAPTPPARQAPRRRIVAVAKAPASAPRWTVAQKDEMDRFLNELGPRPVPSLADRALAMARGLGRDAAQRAGLEDGEGLESEPEAPPADPFSLEMYLDSLVKKLNRSAAFVRNDPRAKGMRTAAVQIRLDANGALKSFRVLNAADQQDEIAFVKAVVERAVPFAPFPSDLRRSARSLAMVICIQPARWGGGFGFTRNHDGRGC